MDRKEVRELMDKVTPDYHYTAYPVCETCKNAVPFTFGDGFYCFLVVKEAQKTMTAKERSETRLRDFEVGSDAVCSKYE